MLAGRWRSVQLNTVWPPMVHTTARPAHARSVRVAGACNVPPAAATATAAALTIAYTAAE